jgi:hypothetical protein
MLAEWQVLASEALAFWIFGEVNQGWECTLHALLFSVVWCNVRVPDIYNFSECGYTSALNTLNSSDIAEKEAE